MLHEIFLTIYRMPYTTLFSVAIALLFLGGTLHVLVPARVRHIAGYIGMALALFLIIYSTLMGRTETVGSIVWIPGYSFVRATYSDEYLRMLLMNIFLFVPYGIFVSLAFDRKSFKNTVLISMLSSLGLTIAIEAAQFTFGLGCAETVDVICNVLGAFIGIIPYLIIYLVRHAWRKNSKNR